MKWRQAVRKARLSDRYDLESLPGAFIVRKKFTVAAQERMAMERERMELDEQGAPVHMQEGQMETFHLLVLRYGLEDTNLTDDEGKKVELDDPFFQDLLAEAPDVEQEIFDAITAFNSPLAQKNGGSSGTAPVGSSPDDSSPKEQEATPTE